MPRALSTEWSHRGVRVNCVTPAQVINPSLTVRMEGDPTLEGRFLKGIPTGRLGQPRDIMGLAVDGHTKFSTTWGGGVKFYANDNVGFNVTARFVPTYISSDASGYWCSPYWGVGCWVVSQANYSNQFDIGVRLLRHLEMEKMLVAR